MSMNPPVPAAAEQAAQFFFQMHYRKYRQKKLGEYLQQKRPISLILEKIQFKKVKAKALVALQKWQEGSWRFILVEKVLTPYQVLAWQARGVRPVSMIPQEKFAPILHKEDTLEFFLHDLEHGYMFFFDEQLSKMQQHFFQQMEMSIQQQRWNAYLTDPIFREKFFYLISDMNTHGEHYRSYLNALLPRDDAQKFADLFTF